MSESRLSPKRDGAASPNKNNDRETESIREIWRSSDVEQRFGSGKNAPRMRANAVIGESTEGFHSRIEASHEIHTPGAGWQSVSMHERWSAARLSRQEAMQGAKEGLRDFNRFWAERTGKEPSANAAAVYKAINGNSEIQKSKTEMSARGTAEKGAKERVTATLDRMQQSKGPSPRVSPVKNVRKKSIRLER